MLLEFRVFSDSPGLQPGEVCVWVVQHTPPLAALAAGPAPAAATTGLTFSLSRMVGALYLPLELVRTLKAATFAIGALAGDAAVVWTGEAVEAADTREARQLARVVPLVKRILRL